MPGYYTKILTRNLDISQPLEPTKPQHATLSPASGRSKKRSGRSGKRPSPRQRSPRLAPPRNRRRSGGRFWCPAAGGYEVGGELVGVGILCILRVGVASSTDQRNSVGSGLGRGGSSIRAHRNYIRDCGHVRFKRRRCNSCQQTRNCTKMTLFKCALRKCALVSSLGKMIVIQSVFYFL